MDCPSINPNAKNKYNPNNRGELPLVSPSCRMRLIGTELWTFLFGMTSFGHSMKNSLAKANPYPKAFLS
jgi:hypothetical protein